MRFLDSLGIPTIAVLSDSQNFVESAEQGIGLHEMHRSLVRPDLEQLERIARWLDGWSERRQTPGDVAGTQHESFSKVSYLNRRQAESA